MNEFQTEVLRQVVGHCSHNIGWNGIHASSLDLLTEVLQKYLTEIGQSMHRYSEQFGRTEPNVDDLGLTFRDMGITIQDLSDYVSNVEPTSFNEDISKIPVAREHNLNFLKPGSHEVLSRPVHIHEHLPPMQHIILGEEKLSGDNQEASESLAIAIQENAELLQSSTLSPRSYPFKRPDGAEKRKGGWLDDEGQPIREISSVMMTTSGYLSSSREGKLPETKIRKVFLEAEVDSFIGIEKKVNMKKVLEGIKKSDDSSKKSEEKEDQLKKLNDTQKDREVVNVEEKKLLQEHIKGGDGEKEGKKLKEKEREKEREREKEKEVEKDKLVEKEREKEKIKKKRNKEKLLEEFNFFEKEKSVSFKPPELTVPIDTTKQKLNIFKKLPKTRDTIDGQLSRSTLVTRVTSDIAEISDKVPVVISDGCGIKGLSEAPLPSVNSEALVKEKVKTSRKERKLKNKRDRHAFPSALDEPVEVQHKRKPGKEVFTGEAVCSIEESLEVSEPTGFGRTSLNKSKTLVADQPKKKRGRPSRVITPETESNEPQNSEVVPATQPQSFMPSLPKPFFPFPPHFGVPGLIPPPFIPNVPFNLLGVPPPLGLRSPLGIPSTNMSTNAGPIVTNASPPPGFYTPPKADSINKVPPLSSPNTKSPNIVDSLPESTEMSLNVTNCEDDPNLMKKKEKRDKKDKEKKKKEKKVKEKVSDEHERKTKREKKKEKKDKEKDKEKTKEKEENITVPKITFKFAAAPTSPAQPATPDPTPKIIFKAIADREGNFTMPSSASRDTTSQSTASPSVEVAKFSALVTRPPKLVKSIKKEATASKPCVESPLESPSTSQLASAAPRTPSPSPKVRREKPQKPPRITKEKDKEKEKKKAEKLGDVAVITETVGSYYDEFGNKIWICPACGRQDDGTPMIGCDECDDWYHWVCVGIRVPPAETESWFCQRCIAKKQGSLKEKKKGRKKKTAA